MTRLTIPYAWTARVRPASGGKAVERTYREVAEVVIPDVPAADAPVALRWKDGDEVRELRRSGDGLTGEVTSHRWVREDGAHGEWRHVPVAASYLAAALDGTQPPEGHLHIDPGAILGIPGVTKAREVRLAPPRNVDIDYPRDARSRAREEVEALSRFSFVNGMLHAPRPEPVLVADPANSRVRVARQGDLGPDERMRAYRMTELDAAVDHAARVGGVAPSRVALPSFEVLDASVLRHDPLPAALWDAARKVDGVAAKAVRRLDAGTIELLCDLEDARRGPDADPDAVASAVSALASAVSACSPDLAKACAEPAIVAERWAMARVPAAPSP